MPPPGPTDPNTVTSHTCSVCGTSLATGRLGAQCPRCLLSLGSSFGLPEDELAGAGLLDAMQVRSFGDYELLEEVARGGMGVVYRARQISLNREVAIKMILAGELAGTESLRMFRREAHAAANLHHPNIVPVYEIGEHETQHYFTMRFVPGGLTIAGWARTRRRDHRAIALAAAQVARAVAFAHMRGVLHRDLKPSNILWDGEGGPQVADFGLAKVLNESDGTATRAAQVIGSPSYMAPEQMGGRVLEITTATDVYGLGAVLYELLSGRPPFSGASALETMRRAAEEAPAPLPEVPKDLRTICLKCLAKKPEDRYASAAALADDLERFARGEPVSAVPLTPVQTLWRWCQRNPKLACALASSVVILAVGIAGITWQWRKAETARKGETRAREQATATVVDLYTNSGVVAAKAGETPRAALWFAKAAMTPTNDPTSSEANQARWLAWRNESHTPVRAFESGVGPVDSLLWNSSQTALICKARRRPAVAVWDVGKEVRWQPTTEFPLEAAAWAHTGALVLAGGGVVRLTEFPSGRELARSGYEGAVACLAVSEDDQWIAVGAATPMLWNVPGGETVPLPSELGPLTGVEFSRDGLRLLLTGSASRGVCALAAPKNLLFPPVESIGQTAQGFLGGGDHFFTLTAAGSLIVMESTTGAVVETYPCGSDPASAPKAASPDGRFIARHSAPVIDRSTASSTDPLKFPLHKNRFEALDFSADSTLLATASFDDTVRFWHLPDGKTSQPLGSHQEGASAVAISPDQRLVATGQIGGGLVKIWRLAEAPVGREIPLVRNSRFRLSHDNRLLVPSGWTDLDTALDHTRVYAVDSVTPVGPEIVPGGLIMDAEFAPDGAWLALVCSTTPARGAADFTRTPGSGTLQFWDYRTGQRLGDPITFASEPRAISVHPGGRRVAVYGARMTLEEVDVSTRQARPLHTATDEKSAGEGVNARCRYSPDGQTLVAWGMSRPPVVWDASTDHQIVVPKLARSLVMDLDFHGQHLGTAALDSRLEFLALPNLQPVARTITDSNWLFVGRFSPEGDLFLIGGRGRIGHIWDWHHNRLKCPALEHDGEIFGAAFIPGSEYVVTGGLDKCIRFWDRRTGLPVRPALAQEGNVMALTATLDGRLLISNTKDEGHIHLYDVATLLPKPSLPPDDALLLAEIDASAIILHGGLEPLCAPDWLKKWKQFRAEYPDWHRW